jgi:hypothetical protein
MPARAIGRRPACAQEREWAADERRSTPIRNSRVFIRVYEHFVALFQSAETVPAGRVVVFPVDSMQAFALLQSRPHLIPTPLAPTAPATTARISAWDRFRTTRAGATAVRGRRRRALAEKPVPQRRRRAARRGPARDRRGRRAGAQNAGFGRAALASPRFRRHARPRDADERRGPPRGSRLERCE